MGSDERELQDLLHIKKRRLAQLQRQAASLGYGAPPELRNEIEDLQRETTSSSQVIEPIVKGELPDDIMAALRAYGAAASVNNALQLVEAALYNLQKAIAKMEAKIETIEEKVESVVQTQGADQVWRLGVAGRLEDSDRARVAGQRRNFHLSLGNIGLILFVMVLVIILFWTK